jgi:DNA-binding MarR family transcriptional regulator
MKNRYKHDENMLFLLTQAHWKMYRILNKQFRKSQQQITPDQWLLMLNLYNEGPLYQSELARKQFKDRAAIKRLADQLCEKDLIIRKKSTDDRRLKRLELTEKGVEIILELNIICQKTIKRSVRDLSEVEINALKRLIQRIVE